MFKAISTRGQSMFHNRHRLAAVLVAGGIGAGCLGLAAGPASAAVTFGPNNGGSSSGTAYCDMVHHDITVSYTAQAESTWGMNGIEVTSYAVPEYIDVYAYVKASTSTTWGAPVAHTTTLLNTSNNVNVLSKTLLATAGRRYNVGFYVRLGYPGATWSSYIWDVPATYYDSYSGTVFAPYSFCQT
jgi:hypothetical protein